MSKVYHIINDTSSFTDQRDAVLYGGTILEGGAGRPYKKVLYLDNDISSDPDNTNAFAIIQGNPIITNEFTVGFWIYPKGKSAAGAGVVLNRAEDKSYGVIINSNGVEYLMGYVWGDPSHNHEFNLNVVLPKETWTHIVVIVYADGTAKLFGNNKYLGFHDLGHLREEVEFDNIELGRFSGMLDDVVFYNKALQYGNVSLGQTAWSEVSYLFHKNRKTGLVYDQTTTPEDEESDFYYIQNKEYVEAYKNYIAERDIAGNVEPTEVLDMLYTIKGGENEGTYAPANGAFRTIPGEIKEETSIKEGT